ncbi:ABC transporter permease [Pollutibacter soli]|uniref:ABC transporter permease n=1 Tax=Pollutibacter soli TaxID=3034157 RepID=UPI003013CD33
MFRNYVKTAWRSLMKNKFYSSINIIGLTVGLAVGVLILLWVLDEKSYDAWHSKGDEIFKIENMVGTGDSKQIWTSTVAPIAKLAKAELPEVKEYVRLSYNGYFSLYKSGDKIFNEDRVVFTDPALFSLFDYPLLKGNPAQPFKDEHSVIITESTAKRYFGNDEPLGKIITADDTMHLTVTGVVKDFPHNTYIKFNLLTPISLLTKIYKDQTGGKNIDDDFNQFNNESFVQLQPGTDLKALGKKLEKIHLRIKPEDTDAGYMLEPLAKIHLYKSDGSDGGIGTVRIFSIIALVILIIACINYVNLSTARSMLRSKEVSLRKIAGAAKAQLFIQFIVETAVLFVVATIFALTLLYVLLPYFNELSGKDFKFDISHPAVWKIIVPAVAGTLIASSIYPALLLSSFEPLKALKGKISARLSDTMFRKVLVVIQFSFSIILIAGTIIIGNQLKYIRSKDLGYDKEHVLSFFMRDMASHYDAVKAELEKQPGVMGVARSSSNIVRMAGQTGDNEWDGKMQGETMMLRIMATDADLMPFFSMKLAEGKNFTRTPADSHYVILNETAVKVARIKDPIGKKFRLWQNNATILGVVKDFHFASMKQKIEPAVFYFEPKSARRIYIKTTAKDAPQVIDAAGALWKKYNPDFAFDYAFLDETFNRLYISEQKAGTLFNIFAGIAIIISCLGLFGLATYTAQTKIREIGVRKVLGASVPSVVRMLAGNFLLLVFIAMVISIPIAWYMMSKWLEDFAYKTNLSWTVFAISGILAIVIAVLTISYQSIRAALANPVKSLRTE